jgi:hypothetical protein
MKTLVTKLLKEAIKAHEAHGDINSIQTVIDNKRNLSWVTTNSPEMEKMIRINGLKVLRVPSNKYGAYIVYKEGSDAAAMELNKIAEKYNGYLAHNATEEDSIRIGRLLGYDESDIKDYVMRKRRENNKK